MHNRYGVSQLISPKNTIIIEDRAYFGFTLMRSQIEAKNIFVTQIKENTTFKNIEELELPEVTDQNILKDEIILLNSG